MYASTCMHGYWRTRVCRHYSCVTHIATPGAITWWTAGITRYISTQHFVFFFQTHEQSAAATTRLTAGLRCNINQHVCPSARTHTRARQRACVVVRRAHACLRVRQGEVNAKGGLDDNPVWPQIPGRQGMPYLCTGVARRGVVQCGAVRRGAGWRGWAHAPVCPCRYVRAHIFDGLP